MLHIGGADFNSVVGDDRNTARGDYSTVTGGTQNDAGGYYSTVTGSDGNEAGRGKPFGSSSARGDYSTVRGGISNDAHGLNSTVGGGALNQILNSGGGSTILGGDLNFTNVSDAVLPGGGGNQVNANSGFAAGKDAQVDHAGSFVWADSGSTTFVTTGVKQFIIRADSGVGVGTHSPTEMLHAAGISKATAHTNSSDARLKTNIRTIESPLRAVAALRGVSFEWTESAPALLNANLRGRHVGFIAQEIVQVVPEAVTSGSDGLYSVSYGRIVALLVEAIKEQEEQIRRLERWVAERIPPGTR